MDINEGIEKLNKFRIKMIIKIKKLLSSKNDVKIVYAFFLKEVVFFAEKSEIMLKEYIGR